MSCQSMSYKWVQDHMITWLQDHMTPRSHDSHHSCQAARALLLTCWLYSTCSLFVMYTFSLCSMQPLSIHTEQVLHYRLHMAYAQHGSYCFCASILLLTWSNYKTVLTCVGYNESAAWLSPFVFIVTGLYLTELPHVSTDLLFANWLGNQLSLTILLWSIVIPLSMSSLSYLYLWLSLKLRHLCLVTNQ